MKLEEIKAIVIPILKKHNITKAGIFGSYANGSATAQSDIDLLVELGEKISLLDFVGIKFELEDALGQHVDLVEYESIKPLLKDDIMNSQVIIL
ncbi:MAG: nucleotidyltransferase family protein [Bacteroidales bacterium]|nr:nucleotidyltransferase family protein [Bacteroidales bacterium]